MSFINIMKKSAKTQITDEKMFTHHYFIIVYAFHNNLFSLAHGLLRYFSSKPICKLLNRYRVIAKHRAWFNLILHAEALSTVFNIITLLDALRLLSYWQLNEISANCYLFLALKKSFTNAAWNEVLPVFCYVLKQNSSAMKKAKKRHQLNGKSCAF